MQKTRQRNFDFLAVGEKGERGAAQGGRGRAVRAWAYIFLWSCRSEKLFRVSDACILPKFPKATEIDSLLFAQNSRQNFIHGTIEQRKEGGNDFVIVLRRFAFIAQELDARLPTVQKSRRNMLSCGRTGILCQVSLKARANVFFPFPYL